MANNTNPEVAKGNRFLDFLPKMLRPPVRQIEQKPPIIGYYEFTEEEIRTLQECDKESFYGRCLPLSTLFATLTYIAVKNVDDLTKKWKHFRDYYVREKKKQNLRSGSAAPKKRITPYFEMLSFLSVSLQSRDTEGNLELPDELISDNSRTPPPPPTGTPPPPASTSSNLSASDRKKITPFQKSLLQKIDSVDKTADDPDKNFLLSMLPDMRSMTDREKFEFKFEIMSAIKRIKYNYQVSEYSPTSSTRAHNTYEYRPTSIASTSNSSNTHGDITKRHSSTDIGSPAMTELSTEDLDEILNNETSLLDNEPCE